MEADLYPRNRPERADLIDGAIGEGSHFHQQFGYYAQGVGERTACAGDRRKSRRPPKRRGATASCRSTSLP